MLFDIESFDYSYYDEGSEGLKVALVHHLDMPIMRQTGFHIGNRYNSTNTTLQILWQNNLDVLLWFFTGNTILCFKHLGPKIKLRWLRHWYLHLKMRWKDLHLKKGIATPRMRYHWSTCHVTMDIDMKWAIACLSPLLKTF